MLIWIHLYCIDLTSALFLQFINLIIVNHYLTQWFPVQSLHTNMAILFCDIMKR